MKNTKTNWIIGSIGSGLLVLGLSYLCASSAFAALPTILRYHDVDRTANYAEYIEWAVDNEIMAATPDDPNIFGVGEEVTSAEFVDMLSALSGESADFIEELTGLVVTENPISRLQAMNALAKYAEYGNVDITTSTELLSIFSDGSIIPEQAAPYVTWCLREGVVSSPSDSKQLKIQPEQIVLKEDAAEMLRLTAKEIAYISDGAALHGWFEVNGAWRWFSEKGELARSTWIDNYYVNEDGNRQNDRIFRLMNCEYATYVDIADDAREPGSAVVSQQASGSNSSKWMISSGEDGVQLLGGTETDSALSVNRSAEDGSITIAVAAQDSTYEQKWSIEHAEGAFYRIRNIEADQYLTADENGKLYFTQNNEASTTQMWELIESEIEYDGFQNPSKYYQVSNKSVTVKNQGEGIFGYRTESVLSHNATREDCIEAMIDRAYDYLEADTPYIWDYACEPGVGVDCAGLVLQCLYATGMDLGRMNPWDHFNTPGHDNYAGWMYESEQFQKVPLEERQRGDLIFYEGHVAIYLGNDMIIDAYPPVVRETSIWTHSYPIGVARPFSDEATA